jgi:hypothetical protein
LQEIYKTNFKKKNQTDFDLDAPTKNLSWLVIALANVAAILFLVAGIVFRGNGNDRFWDLSRILSY